MSEASAADPTPLPARLGKVGAVYLTGAGGGVMAPVTVARVTDKAVVLRHLMTNAEHPVEKGFLLTPAKLGADEVYRPDRDPTRQETTPGLLLPTQQEAAPSRAPSTAQEAEETEEADEKTVKVAEQASLPLARGQVKRIRGTIKGGVDVEVPGRHVVVIGDNGSAKSALAQHLELAFTGGASDIAGREWVSDMGELRTLVDDRQAASLHAEVLVETVDGREGSFIFDAPLKEANKTGIAKPTITTPAGIKVAMPMKKLLEDLRGTPERARKFLLGVACTVTPEQINRGLPEELRPRYLAVAPTDPKLTHAERLLAAQGTAKTDAAEAKREAGRLEVEVQTAGQGLGTQPDEAALEAAQTAVTETNARLVAAAQAEALAMTRAQAKDAAVRAAAAQSRPSLGLKLGTPQEPPQGPSPLIALHLRDIASLEEECARMETEAQALLPLTSNAPPAMDPKAELQETVLTAARTVTAAALELNSTECLLCAGPLPRTAQQEIVAGLDETLLAHRMANADLVEQHRKHEAALTRMARLQEHYTQALERIEDRRKEIARLEQAAVEAAAVPRPSPVSMLRPAPAPVVQEEVELDEEGFSPSVEEAQLQVQAAGEAVVALRTMQNRWMTFDGLRGRQQQAAARQRDMEYLHRVLTDIVANLVTEGARAWTARVQKHLPKGDVFWFNTSTGRFGLRKEVTYADGTQGTRNDSALCGAEWARVTMAICAACIPADVDVAVLVPEDRDWSSRTLREVLVGLSNFPGTIIFTTATRPHRGIPKGWGVIVQGRDGSTLLSAMEPDSKTLDAALKIAFDG